MSAKGMNPFEAEARRRKVKAIVDRIDDECTWRGIDPRTGAGAFAIADMLSGWADREWQAMADNALVNLPRKDSRDLIVAEYRERGAAAQRRAS
jgi:hypothetical protein